VQNEGEARGREMDGENNPFDPRPPTVTRREGT